MIEIQKIMDSYYDAVYDTNRDLAHRIISNAVEAGISPEEIIFEVVIPAIDKMVQNLTVKLDSTISQHFIASKVAEEVTELMLPKFKKVPEGKGHIIMGTSWSDFHGLGKKIVSGCLRAHMFTVTDLGLNVPPEKFVEAAVAENARVIGISSMMLHTAKGENGALAVRKILKDRMLEDSIKVIVGGAPYRYDHDLYKEVAADGWAENGVSAVAVIKELLQG